jgi:signal transduction histidine kinase/putative methionine-R-sulfoxide reductase with GAF domain/ActR/RegA family two-component response regulator
MNLTQEATPAEPREPQAERRKTGPAERRRTGVFERERAFRLQLLADVGRGTSAILSRPELLRTSVHLIQETFHYFMVNIFLVEGEDLVLRACTMPEFTRRIGHLRMRLGQEGINGWVAQSGEPLNVADVRVDARYRWELTAEKAVRSELAVPILLKGAVIGTLDAQSRDLAAFNELDVFTLETVAGQLAVALENARLYEELEKELAARRRTEKLLRALHVAGLSMEMAASPEEVFARVGEELGRVGLPCALHLVGDDHRSVSLAYASPGIPTTGTADEAVPVGRFPLADSRVFVSIEAGAHAVYEHGLIVAPLLFEERLRGFLTVLSPEIGIDDIPAIQVFANEIAAAWSKARLVRELRQSLQDLQRTQEQLLQSQKMEAVGRLAGGVAHDFNNQLTAIMGYADVLLASLPDENPQRGEVREILRAAGRAADLTRQLLAFSRRQVLRPRIVDLNVLVMEMRGMLQRLIGENITLETRCAQGPLRVRADPAQLEQVVMNLAVNARDAMPLGGTLEIATEGEPAGGGSAGSGFHVVRVTDNGTGMSPEVMSRLFEPFFTTKEPGRGTGLGLSTAYGIVKQSGGHISCQSVPRQGTTFVIHLPATEEAPAAGRTGPEAPAAAGREKILVVEDETQVRELIQRILQGAGYSVVTAGTGDEGMGMVSSEPGLQMVVTDLVLPGSVSGVDIARKVATEGSGIRLLCISGYSEQLVSGAPGFPYAAPFLQKPFSASELLKKIREILDHAPGAAAPAPAGEPEARA